MPGPTRWMIRASFVWLGLGLAIQLASPFASNLPAPLLLAGLRAFEVHALTVGWLSQLIFGVVFWMFPKAAASPRGSPRLAMITFAGLNLGLGLRAIGELFAAPGGTSIPGWALPASAVLQWLAAIAFVINTWPRVRER